MYIIYSLYKRLNPLLIVMQCIPKIFKKLTPKMRRKNARYMLDLRVEISFA